MSETITPRCLPIREAARYLGITETMFRSTVQPKIKPVYMSPRRPVWLRDQLDAFINEKAGLSAASQSDELMDAITGH